MPFISISAKKLTLKPKAHDEPVFDRFEQPDDDGVKKTINVEG
jgi:hypothetical protein